MYFTTPFLKYQPGKIVARPNTEMFITQLPFVIGLYLPWDMFCGPQILITYLRIASLSIKVRKYPRWLPIVTNNFEHKISLCYNISQLETISTAIIMLKVSTFVWVFIKMIMSALRRFNYRDHSGYRVILNMKSVHQSAQFWLLKLSCGLSTIQIFVFISTWYCMIGCQSSYMSQHTRMPLRYIRYITITFIQFCNQ